MSACLEPESIKPEPLLTDLYELTMAAVYHRRGMNRSAVFSLFIRNYPGQRAYFVAAGIQDTIDDLVGMRFSDHDLTYLSDQKRFAPAFLDYLADYRFSGEVRALAEGTLFYTNEPILEITAPLIEAQLLETFLLNRLGFPILVASKAARCVEAAQGRSLMDFGLRRAQGRDAGLTVARSSYLAGFQATSNVLAGKRMGIPTAGTMAHSFVTAFESEQAAFEAYAEAFPQNTIFLIDTYDTLEGARQAVRVARQLKAAGTPPVGVRLDSGDMVTLSREVRRILDQAGLTDMKIIASSGFDEYQIAAVLDQGAAIDGFGVGTKLSVSADAPYADIVCKLVDYDGRPIAKQSPAKQTLAGAKQIFRQISKAGDWQQDILGLRQETGISGTALLRTMIQNGKRLTPTEGLDVIRQRFQTQYQQLPANQRRLSDPNRYGVILSQALKDLQMQTQS